METATVYLSALQESLQKKQRIMEELLTLTQQQSEVLQQENMDIDVFEQLMAQKEKALGEINILDKGFDSVYHKVSPYLEQDKQSYRSAILEMQNLLRVITDCGVKIEGLERRNREVFQRYLLKQRQEIGNSRASSRTAVSYYQNMPNQHHAWQSYFLDKKK